MAYLNGTSRDILRNLNEFAYEVIVNGPFFLSSCTRANSVRRVGLFSCQVWPTRDANFSFYPSSVQNTRCNLYVFTGLRAVWCPGIGRRRLHAGNLLSSVILIQNSR